MSNSHSEIEQWRLDTVDCRQVGLPVLGFGKGKREVTAGDSGLWLAGTGWKRAGAIISKAKQGVRNVQGAPVPGQGRTEVSAN